MKKIKILLFVLTSLSTIQAQIDGANVFGTNQVIRVDITFSQTGFWDSLTTNYETETDMLAANVTFTDLLGTHSLDSVAIRLKGNSSYGHPGNKKSFKLDLNDYVSGQNYDGLKKLNFNNCFKDPTFMREKIFFDLCNELNVPAPRVNYANVYMNGTFWGFYALVEQIDDQFLDWAILDDQGNLFKAGDNFGGSNLAADLLYYGTNQSSYEGRYELKTNETANDWSDLITLIDFINNSSNFSQDLSNYFDKTELFKTIALDNLFSSLDSYLNSARNYYIYHNQTSTLWEWIKWDGNEAFGLYTGGPGLGNLEQLVPNYAASNRPLLSKIFSDPTLYQEYLNEMCSILESHFNSTYMNAKIDEIKTLIEPHVTADNNKMYTTQNFLSNVEENISVSGGPMGSQTVFGLKSFITNRNDYLSNSITCTNSIEKNDFSKFISFFPNPFEDEIYIAIAPNKIEDLKIIDNQGRKVDYSFSEFNGKIKLNLNVKSGIYFITFTENSKTNSIKISKE